MRFACQPGCTTCCTRQGFVYFTERDIVRAAEFLGMTAEAFERRYIYRTRNLRRLRTPRQGRCHFLQAEGCGIHPAKPTQCRLFPFWPEFVDDAKEWHKTADWCPGIGKGELVRIESARQQAAGMRQAYPTLYR